MPAPLVYMVAGLLDGLDKRDAAVAKQKETERTARAEKDMYMWKGEFDALMANHQAQMETIQKNNEHTEKMGRARLYAESKAKAIGNSAFFIDPNNYEAEFFSQGEIGWEKPEDVDSIIAGYNANFESKGYPERYRRIPHPTNPERHTFEQFTPEKTKTTLAQFKQSITDAGMNADDYEYTIKSDGNFTAKQKNKTDGTPRTLNDARTEGNAFAATQKKLGIDGNVTFSEKKDIGWTFTFTPKKDGEGTVDPNKVSTKYGDSKIPYGQLYWPMVAGFDKNTIMDKQPTIYDLTPEGNLPIFLDEKNPKKQDEFVYGRDVIVWAPPSYDGTVNNAVQGFNSFFKTFGRGVIQQIVNNKGQNPGTYENLRRDLQSLSYNYTYAAKINTNEFVRLADPARDGIFKQELDELREIGDAGLIQAMDSGYTQVVREANASVDLPADTSPATEADGSRVVAKRPAISASSLVERDKDGTPYWTQDFERTVNRATATGVLTQDTFLDVISAAVMPNDDVENMGSPEAVVYGKNQFDVLLDVIGAAFPKPTKQNAGIINNSIFTPPEFGSVGKANLVRALSPWVALEDQLLAVQAAIPQHKLELLQGNGFVKTGDRNRDIYELSGATLEWKKLGEESENARKTLDTVDQTEELLKAGARTGLLSEFEKAKSAINYFFGEAVEIIDGETRKVQPIGVDEDTTVTMPNGEVRTYTARSTIRADLERRLQQIENDNPVFDEDSAQRRKDALLQFNLTVLSYSYAAMLDPNGRLSDADREQADRAIGNSIMATPAQIAEVAKEIKNRANYIRQRAIAWRSGRPATVMAMAIIDNAADVLPRPMPVSEIIRAHIPRRNIQEEAQKAGGAGLAADDISAELRGDLGGQTGSTPSIPTPTPEPRPNNKLQLF